MVRTNCGTRQTAGRLFDGFVFSFRWLDELLIPFFSNVNIIYAHIVVVRAHNNLPMLRVFMHTHVCCVYSIPCTTHTMAHTHITICGTCLLDIRTRQTKPYLKINILATHKTKKKKSGQTGVTTK